MGLDDLKALNWQRRPTPATILAVTGRLWASSMFALTTLALVAGAHAERHVVQRGETIAHVARVHNCTTSAVMRANRLQTTLVPPGTVIEVPGCTPGSHARAASPDSRGPTPRADSRANQALAVIDGPERPRTKEPLTSVFSSRGTADVATWIGARHGPSNDYLEDGRQLGPGQGYLLRRPHRAYGAPHVVDHIRHAIAEVRALYPDVHTLAIGDLSVQRGGKIADHLSHRSGLDVDVGFYFLRMPNGYPAQFAAADGGLHLQATWALLTAFARTASLDNGVAVMFLDYDIQRRLYEWARQRGTPERDLSFLFQYPRNTDAQAGLIRHWPQHANHIHIRFKRGR